MYCKHILTLSAHMLYDVPLQWSQQSSAVNSSYSTCCMHLSQKTWHCTAGARFRLLLLGLQHCRQTQQHQRYQHGVTCSPHIAVLFERILAAALQSFSAPPTWYGKWQKNEARYMLLQLLLCCANAVLLLGTSCDDDLVCLACCFVHA